MSAAVSVGGTFGRAWIVGEPSVVGGLAVFPLSGGGEELSFGSFARGVSSGVTAKELPSGPSVNDIVISNPTGSLVLLLDGEEVLGAKQDRVFDGSVLVPAQSEVQVAVCCVERGRWDARGRSGRFSTSPQVSHPRLRGAMTRGRDRSSGRSSQEDVWASVNQSVIEMRATSVTFAMSDAYRSVTDRLDEMTARVPLRPEQRGAIAFVGGRFAALDWVANTNAYAELHARLVRGYAFDAVSTMERDGGVSPNVPSRADVEALARAIAGTPLDDGGAAGAARRMRGVCEGGDAGAHGAIHVTGLEVWGRIAQVSAVAG